MMTTTDETIARFTDEINAQFGPDDEIVVKNGSRYAKLIRSLNNGQRVVFAFIDRTDGSLLKPAGWNAPAKGVRYVLCDEEDYMRAVANADVHGRFLYR